MEQFSQLPKAIFRGLPYSLPFSFSPVPFIASGWNPLGREVTGIFSYSVFKESALSSFPIAFIFFYSTISPRASAFCPLAYCSQHLSTRKVRELASVCKSTAYFPIPIQSTSIHWFLYSYSTHLLRPPSFMLTRISTKADHLVPTNQPTNQPTNLSISVHFHPNHSAIFCLTFPVQNNEK
jgi:hypothetical protein